MYLQISEEEYIAAVDKEPSFGLYKENYFITGAAIDKQISRHTADAKFQVSVRQRLTNAELPLHAYVMLTYSQKSFWDIYAKSSPFTDNNYNPGLALLAPVINNNRLMGMVKIAIEHESNGQGDSILSRSWN
jgi:phospholipase A1